MWTLTDGITSVATVPEDGVISIAKPHGVKVSAFVNGQDAALHHLHVKAGDTVSFKLKNKNTEACDVVFEYAGKKISLTVPGAPEKEKKMDTSNLFAVPTMGSGMGSAIGGGLGAGLLGGVLGGALLNNGGLLGNKNVTPVTTESVESIVNNSSIQQALGDIKASIPFNEGQVQLALAASTADINSHLQSSSDALLSAINSNNINMMTIAATKAASDNASFSNIHNNIVQTAAVNLAATKDLAAQTDRNSWAITQAITADGDRTRSLIQSIDKTNDSRTITNLANEITELRGDQRLTAATGNITISNNNAATANQAQQQAQLQQQQIALLTANVAALVQQNQHIQQGILNIGSGVVAGNSQTAANTRVN